MELIILINFFNELKQSPIRLFLIITVMLIIPVSVVGYIIYRSETSYAMLMIYIIISIINVFLVVYHEKSALNSEYQSGYRFTKFTKKIITSSLMVDILILYYLITI